MHSSAAPCEYVFFGHVVTFVRSEVGLDPAPAVEQNEAPAVLENCPGPSHGSHDSPSSEADPGSQLTQPSVEAS